MVSGDSERDFSGVIKLDPFASQFVDEVSALTRVPHQENSSLRVKLSELGDRGVDLSQSLVVLRCHWITVVAGLKDEQIR